MTDGDKRMNPL